MTDTPDTTPEPVLPEPAHSEPAVSDPAKLIRLGTMLQTLMVEVRNADTDEDSRRLLARIHNETMEELGTILSTDLMAELSEFTGCCDADGVPTEAEIKVAQAQLVGWLQGLLQGLQASMAAQQALAARQFQQLGGPSGGAPGPAGPGPAEPRLPNQTGTYL